MTDDAHFLRAVEAMLFAADAPLGAGEVARLWTDVTGEESDATAVNGAVERLNRSFADGGRAVRVEAWGGGYRLATTASVTPFVQAVRAADAPQRMSRALLETLAVVAYKQPVTKPEIDHVRGVASDYALRQLLERDLVRVAGRSDGIGRPLLYGTTEGFLDAFGLGALDELPLPREIEDLLADPTFTREKIRLLADLTPPAEAAPRDAETLRLDASTDPTDHAPDL